MKKVFVISAAMLTLSACSDPDQSSQEISESEIFNAIEKERSEITSRESEKAALETQLKFLEIDLGAVSLKSDPEERRQGAADVKQKIIDLMEDMSEIEKADSISFAKIEELESKLN